MPKKRRPMTIDERTVDNLIRLMAAQRDMPTADAARELLRGLARWFGIDFTREAERAAGEEDDHAA